MSSNQLQIFSYRDWYLPEGFFNSQCTLDSAMEKCREAVDNGYSGLRLTGNLSWLDDSDWNSLMEFESILDNSVQDQKLLAVCLYKESKCRKDNIVDVINAHRFVIAKTESAWKLIKRRRYQFEPHHFTNAN